MAKIEHLLASQVADIGRRVGASGLDPNSFKWRRQRAYQSMEEYPMLVHLPSRSRFDFRQRSGEHWVRFSPAQDKEWHETLTVPWRNVLTYFEEWLTFVAREAEAPGFWEAVAEARAGLALAGEGIPDDSFSAGEAAQVVAALDLIAEHAQDADGVDPEELELVRQELDELRHAVRAMGRRQWGKLAIGTLMNLVARDVIPPGFAKAAWDTLASVFKHLPSLLPPGGMP